MWRRWCAGSSTGLVEVAHVVALERDDVGRETPAAAPARSTPDERVGHEHDADGGALQLLEIGGQARPSRRQENSG